MFETVKSGIENPNKVLPYLLGRAIPSPILEEARQYSSKWEWNSDGGFITFTEGGFAGGARDRAEFAARNYYESTQLQSILEDNDPPFERSAEIGAGYGRLSPWIARFSSEHYGIEPNREQLSKAATLYPHCKWLEATAQDLNVDDNYFNLIVIWTVLQHIPPTRLDAAVQQIQRVLDDDGMLILCEATAGKSGGNTMPRTSNEYEEMFESLTLEEVHEREMEPTYQGSHPASVMVFRS